MTDRIVDTSRVESANTAMDATFEGAPGAGSRMSDPVELNSQNAAAGSAALHDGAGEFSIGRTRATAARLRKEGRFRWFGLLSIVIALGVLALLVTTTALTATGALRQSEIGLDITYEASTVAPTGDLSPETLRLSNTRPLINDALGELFPRVGEDRAARRKLGRLVSSGATFQLSDRLAENPGLVGTTERVWLPLSGSADQWNKGRIDENLEEALRTLDDQEIAWLEQLRDDGQIRRRFNTTFFTQGDSREPELAGMAGAFIGSALTVFICFLVSFPVGVATSVYLEEFAPKNRLTDFLEVNINNLAAVPSIVYGLLGLYMFLGVLGMPRSTPLVGGLVLALMALPIIIIASRASLRSVPVSVRNAALGLGASKVQTTFHHVVPLALPGMLTGAIIAMARALGETAPLLLIGMVAFLVDLPDGFVDEATALPVQIFLWFDSPERGFQERASLTIIMLLMFLVLMNLAAVLLRRKLERRW